MKHSSLNYISLFLHVLTVCRCFLFETFTCWNTKACLCDRVWAALTSVFCLAAELLNQCGAETINNNKVPCQRKLKCQIFAVSVSQMRSLCFPSQWAEYSCWLNKRTFEDVTLDGSKTNSLLSCKYRWSLDESILRRQQSADGFMFL